MRLERSRTDSKLFGLCGGIARSLGIDPTLVRLATALGIFFSGGTVFIVYILASMFIPKEPPYHTTYTGYNPYY